MKIHTIFNAHLVAFGPLAFIKIDNSFTLTQCACDRSQMDERMRGRESARACVCVCVWGSCVVCARAIKQNSYVWLWHSMDVNLWFLIKSVLAIRDMPNIIVKRLAFHSWRSQWRCASNHSLNESHSHIFLNSQQLNLCVLNMFCV